MYINVCMYMRHLAYFTLTSRSLYNFQLRTSIFLIFATRRIVLQDVYFFFSGVTRATWNWNFKTMRNEEKRRIGEVLDISSFFFNCVSIRGKRGNLETRVLVKVEESFLSKLRRIPVLSHVVSKAASDAAR